MAAVPLGTQGFGSPDLSIAAPSPTLSYAASTAATSLRPSVGPGHDDASKRIPSAGSYTATPSYSPPHSTSDYAWHKTPERSYTGKQYWYRRQDTIADFCLHWQKRFPGHGDMFGTMLLYEKAGTDGDMVPADVTVAHIRETMRRVRFNIPFAAIELDRRSDIPGIEPLTDIPAFVQKHVDLQVAQTYEIVHSDDDVSKWLDRLIYVHNEPRTREQAEDPQQKEYADFVYLASTQDEMCNRLKVHFWPGSRRDGVPPRLTLEQCHNTSDGIGTVLLMDDVLNELVNVMADPTPAVIQWGSEVCRLPESIQDATAIQHKDWKVTKEEIKEINRFNNEQIAGKATPLNWMDKFGNSVVGFTQRNNKKGWFRRKVVNKPLVAVCRAVAQSGVKLPLGVLPQSSAKFKGEHGGTAILTEVIPPEEAKALLASLKRKGLTAAPFLEASMNMATAWVRRERGLVPHAKKGTDDPERVFGSFANAIDRRNTLRPEVQRFHGICLGGLVTKVAAGDVKWSDETLSNVRPSRLDARDKVPANVRAEDLEQLDKMAHNLAKQYESGREEPNWVRFGRHLKFSTMETEYLFITDENHYPSMPWLSSVGRLDGKLAPSRPIPASPSTWSSPLGTTAAVQRTLEVVQFRLLGKMAIRQPAIHIYSHRGQMTITVSYADWYYDRKGADGRRLHRKGKVQKGEEWERDQSVIQLWLEVYRDILRAAATSLNEEKDNVPQQSEKPAATLA